MCRTKGATLATVHCVVLVGRRHWACAESFTGCRRNFLSSMGFLRANISLEASTERSRFVQSAGDDNRWSVALQWILNFDSRSPSLCCLIRFSASRIVSFLALVHRFMPKEIKNSSQLKREVDSRERKWNCSRPTVLRVQSPKSQVKSSTIQEAGPFALFRSCIVFFGSVESLGSVSGCQTTRLWSHKSDRDSL